MSLCCDKARNVLNWAPQRSFAESLETTVKRYLQWFRAKSVCMLSFMWATVPEYAGSLVTMSAV